jgi:hypothetical protein
MLRVTNNDALKRNLLVTAFLFLAAIGIASTEAGGVIRMSGSGDTVAAVGSEMPVRYIETIRLHSSQGVKHFKLRAGTASDGTLLFQHFLNKDDSAVDVATGTDRSFTVRDLNIQVPVGGVYLETDSDTTSGALYMYTRKANTR